ncbi:hypothetical protein NM208_g10965 [Fusarium decemcellulare]|uniref:Uncharacterized protein n=1 Tax=Fusarium decemcellulare TaxID=57161 RepID=A0ACC1RW00_9HYPO|nr:hypothetical protein NM208_g10965 [Fusarium decemcellulare]
MLDGAVCLGPQPQPSALPCDDVYDPGFLSAPTLALKYITVDSGLKVVLQVWEGLEVKAEKSLAISLSDGAREKKAEEALLVARMRAIGAEEPEWSQLVAFTAPIWGFDL